MTARDQTNNYTTPPTVMTALPRVVHPRHSAHRMARALSLAASTVAPESSTLTREIGRGISLVLAERQATLTLQLAAGEPYDQSGELVLEGPSGAIELLQGERLLRALSGIDIGAEDEQNPQRWQWLQTVLLTRLQDTPFAGTERIVRGTLTTDQEVFALRVTLATAGHAIVSYARADLNAWAGILQQGSWQATCLPLSDFENISRPFPIQVARHIMPRAALLELQTGDVLMPSDVSFDTSGAGSIQLGPLRANVHYQEPNNLEITDIAVSPAPDDGPTSDETGDSPATLEFELGTTRFSMRELSALSHGACVTFEGSPSALSIRCDGRIYGRGEMVDAGGQIAIRLTEWQA